MRLAALALVIATAGVLAAPRVFDRSCDVASRRSDRGGVACGGPSCITVTGTATNYALWSQALATAPWEAFALGAAAPTVTADAAVTAPACADVFNLPGCGQTGVVDRVQFPATTIGQRSSIRQTTTHSEMEKDVYLYAKAVGADCAIEFGTDTTVDFWFTRTTVSSSWVRISDIAAGSSANTTIYIGNLGVATRPSATLGDVARAACDLYLWQVDLHAAGSASRPVKTTSASASQGPGCY